MRRVLSVFTPAVMAFLALASNVHAAVLPDQIEEDWQVVIGVPDVTGAGPQISTGMSPVADDSTPSFVFDLNYRDSPSFSPGGMQVQVWSGDQLLGADTKGTEQCSTNGETITWTQSMKVSSGKVTLAINSGRSTTWGKFGQGNSLNVSGNFTTGLTSLTTYSPATSVVNSGVGWERNCVTSMKLLQVRYYSGGKLISTDNTVRTINLSN